uniref:Retrotransposon protein, putative, Ty1-copia subclass n=1 Tax=Tanacetum cinerariifolium TaxID=118510 RepID=A0A6L2KM88_TANCI|nr:retrotransposon protein, putative, Ty1-copia subclass [Tanacetum cinerariifolium]
MECLVYLMPLVHVVNLILTSLFKDYDQFVQNYNMHIMGKTILKLHAMLKLTEKGIPKKALAILAIGKVKSRKLNRKHEAREITRARERGLRGIQKLNKGALDLYIGNESNARILNMVLTKKIDKTLYEIWHGKLPNMYYLKEHELRDHGDPAKYQAALSDPESNKWLKAMNAEMQSMKDNQVWNLVDLPPNCKTIGSKWLFKKKTDIDGNIHTYKDRLVAKGFPQTYNVNYEETFSPVANIKAIRILIAITVFYDSKIWKMDGKSAFLNGRQNKDVYMVQPEGFVNPKNSK